MGPYHAIMVHFPVALWADFSLTICSEGCPWPEVTAALQEAAPLGAEARTVIVPAADNLFTRAKELPAVVKGILEKPPAGVNLLLVAWTTLPAAPGKALGAKPWTDWTKAGRILKVGALDAMEIPAFIEAEARRLGLSLQGASAAMLAQRQGGHPGLLKRALEVLDLLSEDRRVTEAMVDQVTFRLADQKAFAWSGAWQKGDAAGALRALRTASVRLPAALSVDCSAIRSAAAGARPWPPWLALRVAPTPAIRWKRRSRNKPSIRSWCAWTTARPGKSSSTRSRAFTPATGCASTTACSSGLGRKRRYRHWLQKPPGRHPAMADPVLALTPQSTVASTASAPR